MIAAIQYAPSSRLRQSAEGDSLVLIDADTALMVAAQVLQPRLRKSA